MIDEIHSNESTHSAPDELEELAVPDGMADGEAAFEVPEATEEPEVAEVIVEPEPSAPESGDTPEEGLEAVAIAALEAQVNELKGQLEERSGQYMRIAADFDNYRRRTAREREELEVQFKGNIIADLLPVVDNFERARSHIKPQTDGEMTIHKSYQGVYKQLVEALKGLGVAAMRAEGQEFDPNYHEAVMREATDQYPEGTVIEELVRGYLLGEKVLRHAMVKVSVLPEPGEAPTEAPSEDAS